jgi:hypothetical protein
VLAPPVFPWVLTEATVGQFSWHDGRLHGALLAVADQELLLDLDWPIKWEAPLEGEQYYRSWTAPATLVFHGVSRLQGDLEWPVDADIIAIGRDEASAPSATTDALPDGVAWWLVKTVVGCWRVAATGLTQFVRRPPELITGSSLSLPDRGGISFARGRDSGIGA